MKVPLAKIAHTRSGDKGDTSNIGVIASTPRHYPVLVREVTPERVKAFFGDLVQRRSRALRAAQPRRPELSAARSARRRRHRLAAHRRPGQDLRRGASGHGDRRRGTKPMSDTRTRCCGHHEVAPSGCIECPLLFQSSRLVWSQSPEGADFSVCNIWEVRFA